MKVNELQGNLHFDVVVVGSGLAGLACARTLALKGRRVIVLEKGTSLGGHLSPFERQGVAFEVGLHYIADAGPRSRFAEACRELGISLDVVPLDDEFEELRFADGATFSFRGPFSRFIEDLCVRWPMQTAAFRALQHDADELWELAREVPFPLEPGQILRTVMNRGARSSRTLRIAFLSTYDYLCRTLRIPEEMAEVIWVQHLLMGVSPRRMSALSFLLMHRYYFEEACFVRGGGRRLRDSLLHPDVTYVTGADPRIEKREGGFRVPLEGSVIDASNVVWTPDPRLLDARSPGLLPATTRFRIARTRYPHALVVGYFATRRSLENLGFSNRNYWLHGGFTAEECYRHTDLERLAREGLVYVSMGSLRDSEAVRPGNGLGAGGVFQAMFLVPPRPELWGWKDERSGPDSPDGYESLKKRLLGIVTERLERELRLPSRELVWSEIGTPLTHARYLNSLGMNGYGYASTVSDFLLWRPGWRSGVEGLAFCGAFIRPSHGIVTALVNGVGVGERICGTVREAKEQRRLAGALA